MTSAPGVPKLQDDDDGISKILRDESPSYDVMMTSSGSVAMATLTCRSCQYETAYGVFIHYAGVHMQ